MKECPACHRCFPDEGRYCPADGQPLTFTVVGDPVLEGRYELLLRLGEGGMGMVYKARHILLKTTHAIKVILPELVSNDPSFVTRFRQEAMAAAAIRHHNVIGVTDYGVASGKMPFLVMEFIQGKSLNEVLTQEGRLAPERALDLMEPIFAGVGAAHRRGIVHRDLKPLNIMIEDDLPLREAVKVLDFGLAKIKSGELLGSFVAAKTTGLMGSPYYMAPEQWSDEDPEKSADIYSLGIILYQMLAGDVPFKGPSLPAIMKKHLMEAPPRFLELGAHVPVEIEDVVRHALEKSPEARPETVYDFFAELRDAVAAARRRLESTQAVTLAVDHITRDQLAGTISDAEIGKTLQEARRAAEEEARRKREEEARRLREEEEERLRREEEQQRAAELRRQQEEEEARRRAEEEEQRRRAEEEQRRREAEEQRRREEEEERARREEAERLRAEQERLEREELARHAAEAERLRAEQEEEQRRLRLAEEHRKAEEEEARRLAEEEAARLRTAEETRLAEEARLKREEEERRRAEAEARLKREEEERRLREEEERQAAELRRRQEEEEEREREAAAAAARQAEELRRQQEEEARREAELRRMREDEEARRLKEEEERRRRAAEVEAAEIEAEEVERVTEGAAHAESFASAAGVVHPGTTLSEVGVAALRGDSASSATDGAGASPHAGPEVWGQSGGATVSADAAAAAAGSRSYLPFIAGGAGALVLLVVVAAGLVYRARREEPPAAQSGQTPAVGKTNPAQNGGKPAGEKSPAGMVVVSGGEFRMGRDDVNPASNENGNEYPAHAVNVKTFAIDRTEVTNAEYAEFVRATGRPAPRDQELGDKEAPYWKPWSGANPPAGQEQWPVRNVTLADAEAFAAWRSKRDGVEYRLPTEEEWEYAARSGGAHKLYPWGDEFLDDRAVLDAALPQPVGSRPAGATSAGARDMIGNVWEWTRSRASLYPGNDKLEIDRKRYVIRGGSYQSKATGANAITATTRVFVPSTTKHSTTGFRLVRPAP